MIIDPHIVLTREEWTLACNIAVKIQVMNYYANCTDKDGLQKTQRWDAGIEGFCAEAALAKWLNVWWSGNIGQIGACDVGGVVQAKGTGTDYLIIRPRDPSDRLYVCLRGWGPRWEVKGCMRGIEAKKRFPLNDVYKKGRPFHPVPFSALYPIAKDYLFRRRDERVVKEEDEEAWLT